MHFILYFLNDILNLNYRLYYGIDLSENRKLRYSTINRTLAKFDS
jgi:hypothetical protein